ncbi:MAG: hypothetical protein M1812_001807 [Candelaria pacifica]|nr:MAG: hypothetical protein M1812_001807 [Candelaria pacifica]
MIHAIDYRLFGLPPGVLSAELRMGVICHMSLLSRSTMIRLMLIAGPGDSHALLIRAGFLRQAYSGLFHLLPLGVRVQDKLERLIDKYMRRLGASKSSLSSISSEDLWHQSGRLKKGTSELFRFQDRKNSRYLLSPTHEEEITSLVAGTVKSYKELPLRVYQVSRKYRDEARPRQGLLRTREFLMKDLYTFDYTQGRALDTYHSVKDAYTGFFDECKIPYLVAAAESGDMGGDLSHEFHIPARKGEDDIVSCNACSYVANEELVKRSVTKPDASALMALETFKKALASEESPINMDITSDENITVAAHPPFVGIGTWTGITRDKLCLVRVFYPLYSQQPHSEALVENQVSGDAVRLAVPDLETSLEQPLELWEGAFIPLASADDSRGAHSRIVNLIDYRLPLTLSDNTPNNTDQLTSNSIPFALSLTSPARDSPTTTILTQPLTGQPLDLLKIKSGDPCPKCKAGLLNVQRAIEVGHTFFLGTRYSAPLRASVAVPMGIPVDQHILPHNGDPTELSAEKSGESAGRAALQMGCYGIGISRMLGAVAESLADEKGLNWPRAIAPFDVIIIPKKGLERDAVRVYDEIGCDGASGSSVLSSSRGEELAVDALLDDRERAIAWKLADADLIGYPVIVVVGRSWEKSEKCEVQCRRLDGLRIEVAFPDLKTYIKSLLNQL